MVLKERKKRTATPRSKLAHSKLMELAGVWKDVDTEAMKREIYRRRHEAPAGHHRKS